MNLNKIILDVIMKFVSLSKNFDNCYQFVINTNEIDETNIKNIYNVTKYYIDLRSTHGKLILLVDKFKNMIKNDDMQTDETELDDNLENKLYDLSTFISILSSVNELITNIDFQYKKIAIKYPNYINRKPLVLLLVTDNDEPNNNFVKIFNDTKEQLPENIYKIIKYNKSDKKIKCDKILGINLTLKIPKNHTLFIINGTNVVEIPMDKIENVESLKKLLI